MFVLPGLSMSHLLEAYSFYAEFESQYCLLSKAYTAILLTFGVDVPRDTAK